jgi:hypothetical protein
MDKVKLHSDERLDVIDAERIQTLLYDYGIEVLGSMMGLHGGLLTFNDDKSDFWGTGSALVGQQPLWISTVAETSILHINGNFSFYYVDRSAIGTASSTPSVTTVIPAHGRVVRNDSNTTFDITAQVTDGTTPFFVYAKPTTTDVSETRKKWNSASQAEDSATLVTRQNEACTFAIGSPNSLADPDGKSYGETAWTRIAKVEFPTAGTPSLQLLYAWDPQNSKGFGSLYGLGGDEYAKAQDDLNGLPLWDLVGGLPVQGTSHASLIGIMEELRKKVCELQSSSYEQDSNISWAGDLWVKVKSGTKTIKEGSTYTKVVFSPPLPDSYGTTYDIDLSMTEGDKDNWIVGGKKSSNQISTFAFGQISEAVTFATPLPEGSYYWVELLFVEAVGGEYVYTENASKGAILGQSQAALNKTETGFTIVLTKAPPNVGDNVLVKWYIRPVLEVENKTTAGFDVTMDFPTPSGGGSGVDADVEFTYSITTNKGYGVQELGEGAAENKTRIDAIADIPEQVQEYLLKSRVRPINLNSKIRLIEPFLDNPSIKIPNAVEHPLYQTGSRLALSLPNFSIYEDDPLYVPDNLGNTQFKSEGIYDPYAKLMMSHGTAFFAQGDSQELVTLPDPPAVLGMPDWKSDYSITITEVPGGGLTNPVATVSSQGPLGFYLNLASPPTTSEGTYVNWRVIQVYKSTYLGSNFVGPAFLNDPDGTGNPLYQLDPKGVTQIGSGYGSLGSVAGTGAECTLMVPLPVLPGETLKSVEFSALTLQNTHHPFGLAPSAFENDSWQVYFAKQNSEAYGLNTIPNLTFHGGKTPYSDVGTMVFGDPARPPLRKKVDGLDFKLNASVINATEISSTAVKAATGAETQMFMFICFKTEVTPPPGQVGTWAVAAQALLWDAKVLVEYPTLTT